MKKEIVIMCVSLLLAVSTGLFAADSVWDGGAADGLWSTAANWVGDTLPPNGNRIIIQLDEEVTFDVASYNPNKVILRGETITPPGATLSFSSGLMTNPSYFIVGQGTGWMGTVNITGSTCNITTRDMGLGYQGGIGYLSMSAGQMTVTGTGTTVGLMVPMDSSSMGELHLSGGKIIASQLTMYDYGLIDISANGLLQLAGDKRTLVQGYADNDLIITEGDPNGTVTILYDGGNTFVMSPNNTAFLVKAWAPAPPHTAFAPVPEVMLSWTAGAFAVAHNVYFGTDAGNLTLLAGNITETSVSTGVLNFGKQYFWRVDEIGAGAEVWTGDVWSFTTRGTLAIEEFETYPADPNLLNVWTTNGGASMALATSPAQGAQSADMTYDNSLAPYYSEASYTPPYSDFTRYGVVSLDIWYYGNTSNSAEKMYAILSDGTNSAVLQNDAIVTQEGKWDTWRIALSDFTDANPNLDLTSIDALTFGFGNKVSPQAGGTGTMYIDNIRLWEVRCLAAPVNDLNGDCVVDLGDLSTLAGTWLENGRFP